MGYNDIILFTSLILNMSLDFLLNEINKRKREVQEDPLLKNRKYIKISEIEEKNAQKYWEEKRKREEEKRKVGHYICRIIISYILLIHFINRIILKKK